MLKYQLNRDSPAWNRWSGFYEDVPYNPRSLNQATPTLTAQYLLTHPAPESVDPSWDEHAAALLRWVQKSFGRGPFLGAWGIDEQRAPGKPGCCSRVGLGSTTSRWAAANALLYARTGDERARELAVRSLNYATYFAASDGRVSCCGQRSANTFWFSDGYARLSAQLQLGDGGDARARAEAAEPSARLELRRAVGRRTAGGG